MIPDPKTLSFQIEAILGPYGTDDGIWTRFHGVLNSKSELFSHFGDIDWKRWRAWWLGWPAAQPYQTVMQP